MSTKPKAATAKSTASQIIAPTASHGAVCLDPIIAAMRQRLPKARHAEGEAFASAFYKRMSEEDLPKHSPEGWAALATDFLDFARARKTGSALVRLFNPSLKSHGWESAHTVLQIANDDMPFLVDTVTMALAEKDIGVHVLAHPVVTFRRDKAGKLVGVGEGVPESLMHLEIDRQPAEAMPQIQQAVQAVLGDVRAIVRDWARMRDKMVEVADELGERTLPVSDEGPHEAQEFLRWAAGEHFTFLGYRKYEVVKQGGEQVLCAVKGSGLGLLRGEDAGKPRPLTSLAAHYMPQSGAVDALILTKTNARATVHRPGYMDYIGVLSFDDTGKPVCEERFLGLYTSSAYNRRPWEIPLVRQRHEAVMAASGLGETSHSGKALRHILETLPRDELFQSSIEELSATAMGILALQERARVRACSCAAIAMVDSIPRWCSFPAIVSTATCVRASRRCWPRNCMASAWIPPSASASRRWPSCTCWCVRAVARQCKLIRPASRRSWFTSCVTGTTSCASALFKSMARKSVSSWPATMARPCLPAMLSR